MKAQSYRSSFVLGLIGAVSVFFLSIFEFYSATLFLAEFGQVPEIGVDNMYGVVFLVIGFLALIGCIKGKKVGSYFMAIAGVLMLIILPIAGWFSAALLIAGTYYAWKESAIPQITSL
jgi:hypothetical protein